MQYYMESEEVNNIDLHLGGKNDGSCLSSRLNKPGMHAWNLCWYEPVNVDVNAFIVVSFTVAIGTIFDRSVCRDKEGELPAIFLWHV